MNDQVNMMTEHISDHPLNAFANLGVANVLRNPDEHLFM